MTSVECAREILETVPVVMRFIRTEMRRRRTADLTVPQFRSLAFVDRCSGASLQEVADHLGLTSPSTSRIVEGLEQRRLIDRQPAQADRRRITLKLTAQGRRILETARLGTQTSLADRLTGLSVEDNEVVARAMNALRRSFAPRTGP